jgi:hypothetical protein
MPALLEAQLLTAAVILAAVDSVPSYNVEPFCRTVAMRAAPIGDADICLRQEQEARAQLVRQWPQFGAADKSFCEQLARTGGDPTYTELLTCLELQRDARSLRDRERGTVGQGAR